MTLHEAQTLFERLKTKTTSQSEIKVYDKILHILTELKSREFSPEEIQSIEKSSYFNGLTHMEWHSYSIFFKKLQSIVYHYITKIKFI